MRLRRDSPPDEQIDVETDNIEKFTESILALTPKQVQVVQAELNKAIGTDQQLGTKHQPHLDLLHNLLRARNRKHVEPTRPLNKKEAQQQVERLSPGGKGETLQPLTARDSGVKELRKALLNAAKAGINWFNQERNSHVSVGPSSPYDMVLRLAMQKVLGRYGKLLTEAQNEGNGASTLAARQAEIRLHQADERWAEAESDSEIIEAEAAAAAQYLIDTDENVWKALAKIRKTHHRTASLVSVQHAYLSQVLAKPDKELFQKLAELRMRWGPATIGSDIYIGTPKQVEALDAWTNYRYLVHEVMHTAAHPAFEQYVQSEAPPEVANTILEGTVDYLAQTVWKEIVGEIQADKDSDEIGVVQAIGPGGSKKVNRHLLDRLKILAKTPLYQKQVRAIERAIKALGPERLKAAFFYGDVYHFFPRYKSAQPTAPQSQPKKRGAETLSTEESPPAKKARQAESVGEG